MAIKYNFKYLHKTFSIDLRSLAVFRISIGIILIIDLVIRAQSLTAHYSDLGVLPRDAFFSRFNYEKWYFSIHFMSGEPFIIGILFVLAGIVSFGYTIGYKTKTCAILTWFFLVSLHNRNPLVINGGDNYLAALLFWSLFLPIGYKWSIESLIKKNDDKKVVFNIGSMAIIMQVVSLYIFTGLLKNDPVWISDYTAIYYSLSTELFTTPLGLKLLNYPNLMKFLTIVTIYLERYGMIIFFIPWFPQYFKLFGVLFFLYFHLIGINLTMELGIFQYVCAAGIILFTPQQFWDAFIQICKTQSSKKHFLNLIKKEIKLFKEKSINNTEILINTKIKSSLNRINLKFFLSQSIALFLMIYIFIWNLREIDGKFSYYLPYKWNSPARLLRIDQRWDMFAPSPTIEDGWFVIPAILSDGTQIDLYKEGKPVNHSKPKLVSSQFPNQRWRKYLMNLWDRNYAEYRYYYILYLCNEWNEKHSSDKQIKSVEMVYMLEKTPPPGIPNPIPERHVIFSYEFD